MDIRLNEDNLILESAVDEIVSCLYRQDESEGFDKLQNLLPAIENTIENYLLASNDDRSVVSERINSILFQLLSAMEKRDIIVMADILKYELISCLKY
ncbi:hypothetical protein [Anaerocolumna jejuensis]|uniref:hypothetical protein n=1 Tax=Anaerocolumna jejuensis TaxID=259063 RepID=UPI003F7BD301